MVDVRESCQESEMSERGWQKLLKKDKGMGVRELEHRVYLTPPFGTPN